MKNPLVESVENKLNQLCMKNYKLIYESYSYKLFGNAEAIFELGNLILYFERDRGQDLVSLASKTKPDNFYLFCDVSLMMKWENLNDILNVTEPISLNKALEYIKKDLDKLDILFSPNNVNTTDSKLKEAEYLRSKAIYG